MRDHRFLPAAVVLSLLFWCAPGPCVADFGDRILRLSDGATLGLSQILRDITEASAVFLGEKHDDPNHHRLQLHVIRTLHNLRVPVTIGLEMFTAGDQEALDRWIHGKIEEDQFVALYEANWGATWHLYREIFLYARDRGIPLLGLNVPKEITLQVAREGFTSLTPEQLGQLPGVSCDIGEGYRRFMKRALGAHGSDMDETAFERFCEAQLVWDTTMAYRIARYASENPDRTVVVLAGNSHAWKPGIPSQLDTFFPGMATRVFLPEVPLAQPRNRVDRSLADYLWLLE